MTSETIDAFWNECESDLNTYTNQFNEQMNEFGFKVTYTVVDKNPIGLGYSLKMTYKELTLQQADVLVPSMNIPAKITNNIKIPSQKHSRVGMPSIIQIFDSIVHSYNTTKGLENELHLDYHIFNGVTDSVIYDLEITRLQTQERVSLPCFLLPGDDPEKQIVETLRLLHTFVQLTSDF